MELLEKMIAAYKKCDSETKEIIKNACNSYLVSNNSVDLHIIAFGLDGNMSESDIKLLLEENNYV